MSTVVAPQPGVSISKDGRTAIIQAGANADPNEMVRAADDLVGPLTGLSTRNVSVELTGSSALWANFNKVNHAAMIKSEVLSWPVTMLVLVLAFGSLVAAGLPLMLTLVGLVTAAGALVLSTHIAPVSIWAMNFAMMFALALGIDYALFIVVRFRAALHRRADEPDAARASIAAIAETMGTAGKAVAFSGLTVLVSLSTVLLVPSPAFRSMALGIMLSVIAVLAATLTLLPAVLGRLGRRDRLRTDPAARLRWTARRPGGTPTPAAAECATGARAPDTVHGAPTRTCTTLSPGWSGSCTTGARCCTAAPGGRRAGARRARSPRVAGAVAAHRDAEHRDHPAEPDRARRLQRGRRRIRPRRPRHAFGAHPGRAAAGPGRARHDSGIAAALPAGESTGWTMTLAIPTTDASAPRPPARRSTGCATNCRPARSSAEPRRRTTTWRTCCPRARHSSSGC